MVRYIIAVISGFLLASVVSMVLWMSTLSFIILTGVLIAGCVGLAYWLKRNNL